MTYLTQFRVLTQAWKSQLSECLVTMLNTETSSVMDPISDTKKMIPSGTYVGRELLSIVERMVELSQFVADDQVIKKNQLKGITEMIINLDELNNSNNLEDGKPSNSLLTYHVTNDKNFTCFEPKPHNIGNLKMESLLP